MKLSDKLKSKLAGINLTSIAFFGLSIFSIAFAWFAYTNTVSSTFQADVKTWKIRITNNNTEINNIFDINIGNLKPGMQNYTNSFSIQNQGEIAAEISYNIKYFRIFDTEYNTTNEISFAQLERDYPFVLSFTHGSRYLAPGSTSTFNVTCEWPLDSGNDELDTQYGQMAYNFYQNEQQLHDQNSSYQIRPGLELKIEIVISQYIDETNSFATDSWDTIELAIEKGDTTKYNVGDTKTISINGSSYILRLANKSSPTSCNNSANSQTACGFVVEFVTNTSDIQLFDYNPLPYNYGGYPASNAYKYLNTTLEGQLPIDLQNVLATTKVISGYGNNGVDTSNFTTYDKLYLLSGVEVFGSDPDDTAASTTHQLDYYQGMVPNSCSDSSLCYSRTIKNNRAWWLRTSYMELAFATAFNDGGLTQYWAGAVAQVIPAFRIK